jgi:NAD/NADP transhydrogenase beta subunit
VLVNLLRRYFGGPTPPALPLWVGMLAAFSGWALAPGSFFCPALFWIALGMFLGGSGIVVGTIYVWLVVG